jgi:hypothetical protein
MTNPLITKKTDDFIIAEEVGGKALYIKKYTHPEWPGGQSGPTIGIGYDMGYVTQRQFVSDWNDLLDSTTIKLLLSGVGLKGSAAQVWVRKNASKIVVPWDAAYEVFEKKNVPQYWAYVAKLPNFGKLPRDAQGMLLSLVFNRGASFSVAGSRYTEMRAIKQHMADEQFNLIPRELRSMARLWPATNGVHKRRYKEAAIFEEALQQQNIVPLMSDVAADEHARPEGPDAGTPLLDLDNDGIPDYQDTETQDQPVAGSDQTEITDQAVIKQVQQRLKDLNYHQVGEPDGNAAGWTSDAVKAFQERNDLPQDGKITASLFVALFSADAKGKEIGESRAEATPAKVATKVEAVAASSQAQKGGLFATIVGAVGVAIKALGDYFQDAIGFVHDLYTKFGDIPWWIYAGAGLAFCVFMWQKAKHATDAATKDYQKGRLL